MVEARTLRVSTRIPAVPEGEALEMEALEGEALQVATRRLSCGAGKTKANIHDMWNAIT